MGIVELQRSLVERSLSRRSTSTASASEITNGATTPMPNTKITREVCALACATVYSENVAANAACPPGSIGQARRRWQMGWAQVNLGWMTSAWLTGSRSLECPIVASKDCHARAGARCHEVPDRLNRDDKRPRRTERDGKRAKEVVRARLAAPLL